MTQIGEGIQVPSAEEPPAETPQKKPLKVRISLFFDGTLNNRRNIEAREKNEPAYNEHSNKESDSYENGRTNVAIIEEQVEARADGYDLALKVYTEGPGTVNLGSDKTMGYAMGGGSSGVKAKVEKGLFEAFSLIQRYEEIDPEDYQVEKVTFDVFGFSRGAAGARYAIHQILKDNSRPFYRRLESIGFEITEESVEVGFAGLYDTVASYWAGQFLHTDNWRLKLKAVALAKKVVHLAAAEEHRENFPLHNIKSAGGKGKEYFLPGVHSDVGGSYNKADREKQEKMTSSDEDMVINRGRPLAVERDRKELLALGWYRQGEVQTQVRAYNEWGQPVQVELSVKRSDINSAYSSIPLKLMADQARQDGVEVSPELDLQARQVLKPFPELQTLERNLKEYVASTGNSRSDDWHVKSDALKLLRHNHLHFSAKWSTGLKPRFSGGRRKRYVFDG